VTDKDDGRFKEDANASGDRPSRRSFLVAGAALRTATGIEAGSAALAQDGSRTGTQMPSSGEDLVLYNGKVRTMDDRDSVVSAVRIRGNRFAEVGSFDARGPNAINLNGRTVIPGLIESCDHIVSFGNYRPGYHTVLENAMSIAEIQAILAARRAEVPPGEWITALGAWNAFTMFAERRLPTRAELDAAVPDRPVLLYQTTIGPAVTNTPGIAWFAKASMPVTIGENGNIASGSQSTTALYLLRLTQTRDQRRRTHLETWAYSASVGLTAHIDQEGIPAAPSPRYELGNSISSSPRLDPTQTLYHFDHFRHWDTWWELHREGKTFIRLQMDLVVNELPVLHERIKNQLPFFGNDMMSSHGIYYTPDGSVRHPTWMEAQWLMARAGWRSRSNAVDREGMEIAISAFERINKEVDITGLRWTLHRMSGAASEQLHRLKAVGGNVNVCARSFPLAATPTPPMAPFRTVVDSGIPAGIHMDGGHIATLNPWFTIYYAVTGRNALGEMVNPGQQITRQEALRLFTRGNAYQMNMETKLGSIERGKLADLVVLDKDYMEVGDEELKKIKSVLTVVDGTIIHNKLST
jgi:predicted amidohydrolase YtcJ